jgi:hypothetical protein
MEIRGILACCCPVLAMPRFRQTKKPPIDLISALPTASPTRWSALSKAAVVVAIRSGILSRSEAHHRYMLSEEELSRWEDAFGQDGIAGLQAKSLLSRAPPEL